MLEEKNFPKNPKTWKVKSEKGWQWSWTEKYDSELVAEYSADLFFNELARTKLTKE